MTGRAAGYCAGYGMPGYASGAPGQGYGAGFGRGRGSLRRGGGGRGWRHWFYATGVPGWARYGGWNAAPFLKAGPDVEKQALKEQAEALQAEIEQIQKRLSEIESEKANG
jgi:hypothetical protein